MRSLVEAEPRQVLISVNPHAGARCRMALVEQLSERLAARGLAVRIWTEIDGLAEQASQLSSANELRAVVAAGGDGTAGLVARHTSPGVPIAILPLGTENLLAKQLGLRADPAVLCRAICGGRTVRLDAGLASGKLFLLMVGCGFDAEVVRRLHATRRGHIDHLSYAKPIVASLRNYEYPELRVYCEPAAAGGPVEIGSAAASCERGEGPVSARWVFVANLPAYAVGLRIAPQAVGDDGWLDVCTFKRGSLWHGLRYLAGVVLGRHASSADFGCRRARRVRIESDRPVPYQLDGDPGGYLPVEIEILPQRLTIIVPD